MYTVKSPKDTAVHSKNTAVIPVKPLQAGWVTVLHQVLPKPWLSVGGRKTTQKCVSVGHTLHLNGYLHFILLSELRWKRGKLFQPILKKGSNWCEGKLIVKEICLWIKARQVFKTVLASMLFWLGSLNDLSSNKVCSKLWEGRWDRKAAQRRNVFSLPGERCFGNIRQDKSPRPLNPVVGLCLKASFAGSK